MNRNCDTVEPTHDPPLEIRPGDEIKTTCTYSSLSSNRYVYFGEGTSDEMCFGFLTVYPRDAVQQNACPAFGPLSTCDVYIYGTPVGGCNWAKFVNLTNPESAAMASELEKNCNLNGFCRPECEATVRKLDQHPCLNGEAERFVKRVFASYPEGVELLGRYHSCKVSHSEPDTCSKDQCDKWCDDDDNGWNPIGYDAAPKMAATASAVLLLAVTSSMFALLY
ncbi:dopamine beta-hydroxylase [Elysia marginata]|uniref:Dopamine beta-hydroxylase n=1 Tax=Elysia marginata TaxID=1093978 RepID=A0AAV4JUS0_9GAST|nr:dopamine beta-hydroxylase [Elysia marginata]